jgi:hypothetical protein
LPKISHDSVDLTNPVLKLEYTCSLNKNLDSLMLDLNNQDQNSQEYADLLYEKVISAILNAEKDTLMLQNQIDPTRIKKSWFYKTRFTPELVELKIQLPLSLALKPMG